MNIDGNEKMNEVLFICECKIWEESRGRGEGERARV